MPHIRWRLVFLVAAVVGGACDCSPADSDPGVGATVTPAPTAADETDPTLPGIEGADLGLTRALRSALSEKPEGYEPRTHHFEDDGQPTYVNRLIRETSPYLLQHAHNPVNWFAWGDEAFEKARRENKPVLLSVGYSTCHWCHVMERESFENVEIAAFMNQHFVAIKVDREERPDIDAIYMRAVQMLTGRGGWPMTVVMTPDRQPFFGGTYFPPTDGARGSRKGFLTILGELSEAYRERRDELVGEAETLTRRIQESSAPQRPGNVPGDAALTTAASRFQRSYEPTYGGFGRAPKFPQPARLLLLLRYARRANSPDHGAMVEHTLEKMAAGGMYDQLGGGFHRYSTDTRWLVPHFEKMLYDNAQLAVAYLEGSQAFARPDFATVAGEILDYVALEMTAPLGGFYSATDADSDTPSGHQEEGWFFTWTPEEVLALVGEDAGRLFNSYYQVAPAGNFEGRSILHTPRSRAVVATDLGVTELALTESLNASRAVLYRARLSRPAPLRDDKVLASWNGLMISAFAKGAEQIAGEHGYRTRAEAAAEFILNHMQTPDGRLYRSALGDEPRHRGYLEDYAFVIQGLLDLFEATSSVRWLREAKALTVIQNEHYWDEENGGYFTTADDHESLLVRERAFYDGAVPSGNSVAALNLVRLYEFTGDEAYRERAESLFEAFSSELSASGPAVPRMLTALDYYLDVPLEVVIVRGTGVEPLLDVVRSTFLPNRVLLVVEPEQAIAMTTDVPLLEGKVAIGGRATAYVCERGRCELPTSSPAILTQQLRQVHPIAP